MHLPPVYIFSTSERTKDLCVYSYEKLGFSDIIVIEGESTFREKYLQFANHASNSSHDFFVRADADQVAFSGILEMVKQRDLNKPCWTEGKYFDYFMNRRRGGTPHIIPKKAVSILADDNACMPDSKKPETDFAKHLRANDLVSFLHSDFLTSLHEYEQFPSKVCNSFLNRLKRGHTYLYDLEYIQKNIPEHYLVALQHAINIFNSRDFDNADNMYYADFSALDASFPCIEKNQIDEIYNKLKNVYDALIK